MPYYSYRPIFPKCIISVNRRQAVLNVVQNLAVSDVYGGVAGDGRSEGDQNQIPEEKLVVNQTEALVAEELGIKRLVFPELVVPSIIPQLDSELPFVEVPNQCITVGYPESKLASAVILIHIRTYFKDRTGNSGGRYVLGGSLTLYPSIGERSSSDTEAFVKDFTDQTRHFWDK